MIFLQSDNQLISLAQELAVAVLSYLIGSPLGTFLALLGFLLIVASQVNLKVLEIFEYEHRDNSRLLSLMGIIMFACGLTLIFHNYYRSVSYIPSIFGSEDNIESIYRSVLATESHTHSREMHAHFEESLRRLDRFEDNDESELDYFKAKIAYKYASVLFDSSDYAKASKYFNDAFVLYEGNRSEFDRRAELEGKRSWPDFQFDVNKAYESLPRNVYSNVLRAKAFSDEKDRLEFLHKAKIQVDKILDDHLGSDTKFRSTVWLTKGEIHEELGEDDYFRYYIYSFIADENNNSAVEKINQAGAFDSEGKLNFTPEAIDELISSAPVSISPAIGGDDMSQVFAQDFSELEENSFVMETKKGSNPFFSYTFPMKRCGDSKPTNASAYPWSLNPIYVIYTEERSLRIRASYCQDAFYSPKENKIQVASFSNPEMGHYFDEFLKSKLDSSVVETGAKHVYCTVNSRKPLILSPGQTTEELCSM